MASKRSIRFESKLLERDSPHIHRRLWSSSCARPKKNVEPGTSLCSVSSAKVWKIPGKKRPGNVSPGFP